MTEVNRVADGGSQPIHYTSVTGGLRYAPTTGYYLTALQAEGLGVFTSLGSDRVVPPAKA